VLTSSAPMPPPSGRVATVDALRGIASLSVAWFHFTNANPALAPGIVKTSGSYGWLGVYIFFVISGFVIPYSLEKANYGYRQFWSFLSKRIVRLDPPYFANMAFILALAFVVPLVPGFRGPQPHFTASQLLSHVAYLNSVVGKTWINPVYWSLGIEFQYYLLIGLIFPMLCASRVAIRMLTMLSLLVPGFFVPGGSLLFVHLPLFVAGILTYQYKVGRLSKGCYFGGLAVTAMVTGFGPGVVIAVTCAITSLVIAFVGFGGRILTWLGSISYSLYLMHVPIGGKIVDLGTRFRHGEFVPSLFLIAAIGASIFSAWVLYRLVECPSQRLSSRISYGKKGERQGEDAVGCSVAA
jgi:peptidoglycan/LPS O-acetylase OafA/YrhL